MSVVMVLKGCAVPFRECLHPVIGHVRVLEVIIVIVVERVTGSGVPV